MRTLSITAVFLLLALPLQSFVNCCVSPHDQMHHDSAPAGASITCGMSGSPEGMVLEKSTISPDVILPAAAVTAFKLVFTAVERSSARLTFASSPILFLTPLRI